jgi:hypothetical protein
MTSAAPAIGVDLEALQRKTFAYCLNEANPVNGLVIKTAEDWPCLGPLFGQRRARLHDAIGGCIARGMATLRFFWNSHGARV